ncbi:MAG: response regulator [Gammaproteobacteria bacterium]|jgi:CheY-like chemotaxis protein|nr:response regulator [Gammaproteobacteria bacterium]MDH3862978.1 response regulator [Gammaproteobacteria bacterium]MDH3904315.1 response regulator [Gammaproteobacteria bacterium]MDH3907680.1 response regulator [Gammaproteobacteria bacterium]MDH4003769.1 response regulator [Gammaproteobacteria bacterium]
MVAVIRSNETPGRRALVVDDSRIARYVLSGMLEQLDFDVETADSAEAALNRLSDSLPHVVFMDHLLPGMQGLEAVRKLHARPDMADTRIVMYTSQDSDLFADVARAAGADDVFVKTADSSMLEKILGRLDLLPVGVNTPGGCGNVVALPRREDSLGSDRPLEELLEPILDRHREKLRQDLLSEFAILERYEERMRLETMRRIDAMTERAIGSISRSLQPLSGIGEGPRVVDKRRPVLRAAAIAAALCVGLAIGSVTGESDSDVDPSQTGVEPVAMLVD